MEEQDFYGRACSICAWNIFIFSETPVLYERARFLRKGLLDLCMQHFKISTEGACFLWKSKISVEGLARFTKKYQSFLRNNFHFCTENCYLYPWDPHHNFKESCQKVLAHGHTSIKKR